MELLGIGPLELVFIILLAIIIFGPKDIVNTSKSVGKSLNKLVRSDTWKTINQTSRELKNLPTRLMRESGLDDLQKDTEQTLAEVRNSIQPPADPALPLEPPPTILPTPPGPADAGPSITSPAEEARG